MGQAEEMVYSARYSALNTADELGFRWITVSTATLCLSVAIGSSIVTGDMAGPTKELGIKQEITNLTVTCFVMGFGIG